MRKICKNKVGFTLVEMVLVIAILCIMAMVLFIAVGDYLRKAENATASIIAHKQAIADATAEISGNLSN